MLKQLIYAITSVTLGFSIAASAESTDNSSALQDSLSLATALCRQPDTLPTALANHQISEQEITFRRSRIGREMTFLSPASSVKLEIIEPAGRPRRTAMTAASGNNLSRPDIWLTLDSDCNLVEARRITYDGSTPLYIQAFDHTFTPLAEKEWLNPPLPKPGESPKTDQSSRLRVALIDSGVNYLLDDIARSLATDKNGELIGYDFWDNDNTPFDANPARSPFFVQRHGTRTASITLREAPDVTLVPYRYPRPDMTRMTRLVEHAAANEVRIIGMPLGSNKSHDWQAFSNAVTAHPEILFVVSAGNNGRDIDIDPVYPAVLDHHNILVVTSADDFIRPAERTNYGRHTVDYLLPAENIAATDYDGTNTLVSGSSYAVARMVALAARILTTDPDIPLETLTGKIKQYSVKANTSQYVTTGYIGDPMADTAKLSSYEDSDFKPLIIESQSDNTPAASLNLVALDNTWSTRKIQDALTELVKIYEQCNISVAANKLIRVRGAEYIANLSPGNALTLHRHLANKLEPHTATLYFARDTDMQTKFDAEAFGRGNTGNRPWMRNTVWLSSVTPDTGNAIAHELFHVLANSGQHSKKAGNLMQDRTSPDNTRLTERQCHEAIMTAKSHSLIR